jgi:hypothetical protein
MARWSATNVVTGHNMRGSNAMLHQLHHIQEKTLGYTKCQTTDLYLQRQPLQRAQPDCRGNTAPGKSACSATTSGKSGPCTRPPQTNPPTRSSTTSIP